MFNNAHSTITTNNTPVQYDFISPSSIGVLQEVTDGPTATKTIGNVAENTNDGNIPSPVVTVDVIDDAGGNTLTWTGKDAQHGFSKNRGKFCEKE